MTTFFLFGFQAVILKHFVVSHVYKRCATGLCPGPQGTSGFWAEWKSEVSTERGTHIRFVVFMGISHMSQLSKSVQCPVWSISSAFIVSMFIPFLGFLTLGLKCSVFLFAGVVMQR